MNWIDLIIILALCWYIFDGIRRGFLPLFVEILGYVLAIFLGFCFYDEVAKLITLKFPLSYNLAKLAGFFLILLLCESIYFLFAHFLYKKIPEGILRSIYNRAFGVFPALLKGLIVIAIVLSLLVFIPFWPKAKAEIETSTFGKPLVFKLIAVETKFEKIFGGAISDTLTYLTTLEEAKKPTASNINLLKLKPDPESENKMWALLNEERRKANLKPLVLDPKLQQVAREHSMDMWQRNYFAHNTPEGTTPFDRLKAAGITFLTAGENLALAPTVELAHIGLMNSEDHRANILAPEYKKVGIGIIDAGIYGEMVTQDFTD